LFAEPFKFIGRNFFLIFHFKKSEFVLLIHNKIDFFFSLPVINIVKFIKNMSSDDTFNQFAQLV
jgi:hypothetical protein